MKKVQHPNVLKLYEIIDDDENDNLYLVLEYADKKQSLNYNEENQRFVLKDPDNPDKVSYDENDLRKIMRDLVSGLDYRILCCKH